MCNTNKEYFLKYPVGYEFSTLSTSKFFVSEKRAINLLNSQEMTSSGLLY